MTANSGPLATTIRPYKCFGTERIVANASISTVNLALFMAVFELLPKFYGFSYLPLVLFPMLAFAFVTIPIARKVIFAVKT